MGIKKSQTTNHLPNIHPQLDSGNSNVCNPPPRSTNKHLRNPETPDLHYYLRTKKTKKETGGTVHLIQFDSSTNTSPLVATKSISGDLRSRCSFWALSPLIACYILSTCHVLSPFPLQPRLSLRSSGGGDGRSVVAAAAAAAAAAPL